MDSAPPSAASASPAYGQTVRFRDAGLFHRGTVGAWCEGRPSERGRTALVVATPSGRREPLPAWTDIRSRVHEYGGGAWAEDEGLFVFCQGSDDRLYRTQISPQGAAPEPVALTPPGPRRFADLTLDRRHQGVWCIVEEPGPGHRTTNSIAFVPLSGGAPQRRFEGADFYSAPRPSPDGTKLAFLRWNDPLLPWEGTELCIADVADDGRPRAVRRIAGSAKESVLDPQWLADGTLAFVSDRAGFWHLYRWNGSATTSLWRGRGEVALPPWNFHRSLYGFLDDGTLLAAPIDEGFSQVLVAETSQVLPTAEEYRWTDPLRVCGTSAIAVVSGPRCAPSIVRWDRTGERWRCTVLARAFEESAVAPVPRAMAIDFPTRDGGTAHAFVYEPASRRGPAPLLVFVHGGPTAQASFALDATIAHWTHHGFVVADVNFRGSTGYGRAYRDKLRGEWGRIDVADCADAARFLVARGIADERRVAIRGGSSGGYTALCAAAKESVFRAVTSVYGVTDPASLFDETHKFEAHYGDFLFGSDVDPGALDDRSPMAQATRINVPVLFLQGADDRVVPPAQSERLYRALRERGVAAEYRMFPGEGHGFRRAETIRDALATERAFYERVFAGR